MGKRVSFSCCWNPASVRCLLPTWFAQDHFSRSALEVMSLKRPSHRIVPNDDQRCTNTLIFVREPAETALTSALMIVAFPNILEVRDRRIQGVKRHQQMTSDLMLIYVKPKHYIKEIPSLSETDLLARESERSFQSMPCTAISCRGQMTWLRFTPLLNLGSVAMLLNQCICIPPRVWVLVWI